MKKAEKGLEARESRPPQSLGLGVYRDGVLERASFSGDNDGEGTTRLKTLVFILWQWEPLEAVKQGKDGVQA